jgi:glycosyltransferase involved in cell wall biosynthesis
MTDIKHLRLTVIVPVSSFRNDTERLALWVTKPELEHLSVIIVFDGVSVPPKLNSILRERPLIRLLTGNFGGPGPSRNAGLKLVTTEFVFFCDSDDYPYLERYLLSAKDLSDSQADVAIGQFEIFHEECSKKDQELVFMQHLDDLAVELTKNPGIWRFIFRTSSIKGIEFPDIPMGEDQVFISRYFSSPHEIFLIHRPIYRYVKHSSIQLTKDPTSINRLIDSTKCIVKELATKTDFGLTLSVSFATKQCLTLLKSGSISNKILSLQIFARLFFSFPSLVTKRTIKYFLGSRVIEIQKIHVVLNGGLGNQLFQFAAAILNSGRRRIVLEQNIGYPRVLTSGQASICGFTLPNDIEVSTRKRNPLISKLANFQLRTGLKTKRIIPLGLLSLFGAFFHGIYLKSQVKVLINRGVGWSPLNTSVKRSELLIGYFQSYLNQDNQTLARIRSIFTSQTGAELENLVALARAENPLVVHVRLQDYVTEANFGIPGIDYYEEAIGRAFNPSRHKKIWLFSDDAPQALTRIPEKLRPITRVIEDVDGSDCNSLVAMTQGLDFVLANSSFSWWAARMSIHSDAQVHYPHPWFANMDDPYKLVPDEWHSHDARFQSN